MNLAELTRPRQDYSYAFLDAYAKRELRRRILKAIAIPGYQVPYASRELPIARGWGTGGLQVTLSLVSPRDTVKVIDQGADDSVNAANLRRFIARVAGVATTTDTLEATIIQSRHRFPEERLRAGQVLVLQVPYPEPLIAVQPSLALAREMHADADYALMWLDLYEQLVLHKAFTGGANYPVIVHQRYLMASSPIPRWDTPMFHQAAGEFLLVSGANGVGKSTLLRCLYRTYLPSAGQALFCSTQGEIDLARAANVDIAWLRRREIGHVTQFLRPRPRVSALDLVAEPLVLMGESWAEARRVAGEWLLLFGLKPDIWQAYPTTFSGGEQQKVNLVHALIAPRRLLLLDEPTASLDATARAALVRRLAQLKARGVAMIGVFHHPQDIRALVDAELTLSSSDRLPALELEEANDVAE